MDPKSNRIRDWQQLSWTDIKQLRPRTVLLAAGTVEAHGEGPIGTDNFIPERLVHILAERLDLLYLPVMPYGVTTSLLAYPGGIRLEPDTLERWLMDVGTSLKRGGVSNLILINGHGGNTEAFRKAARRLFLETDLHAAVIDWWQPVEAQAKEIFTEGLGHAAMDEMAALVGLRPDLATRLPRREQRTFHYAPGIAAYPAPEAVMIYARSGEVVDWARITDENASRFVSAVVDTVESIVRDILTGWEKFEPGR